MRWKASFTWSRSNTESMGGLILNISIPVTICSIILVLATRIPLTVNRHVKLALAAGEIGLQNDDAVDLRARHAAIQTHFAEDVNAYIHTLAVGQFQDFLIPVRVDLGVDGLVRAQSFRLFKTGLHFAHDDHTCAAGFCERDGCGTQTTSSLD